MSDPLVIHQSLIPPRCRVTIDLALVHEGSDFPVAQFKADEDGYQIGTFNAGVIQDQRIGEMLKVKQNSRK